MKTVARQYYGAAAEKAVDELNVWLAAQRKQPEVEKLQRVNQWWNQRLRFDSDQAIWGQADYWATPLEALAAGAADCEDYSIAKYSSLLELGVAENKLRLVYVRARLEESVQAHMVLAYYPSPSAEPWVLDNLNGQLLPASQRPDLTPLFSFNAAGVWLEGSSRPQAGAERLSRWRELLARLKGSGF